MKESKNPLHPDVVNEKLIENLTQLDKDLESRENHKEEIEQIYQELQRKNFVDPSGHDPLSFAVQASDADNFLQLKEKSSNYLDKTYSFKGADNSNLLHICLGSFVVNEKDATKIVSEILKDTKNTNMLFAQNSKGQIPLEFLIRKDFGYKLIKDLKEKQKDFLPQFQSYIKDNPKSLQHLIKYSKASSDDRIKLLDMLFQGMQTKEVEKIVNYQDNKTEYEPLILQILGQPNLDLKLFQYLHNKGANLLAIEEDRDNNSFSVLSKILNQYSNLNTQPKETLIEAIKLEPDLLNVKIKRKGKELNLWEIPEYEQKLSQLLPEIFKELNSEKDQKKRNRNLEKMFGVYRNELVKYMKHGMPWHGIMKYNPKGSQSKLLHVKHMEALLRENVKYTSKEESIDIMTDRLLHNKTIKEESIENITQDILSNKQTDINSYVIRLNHKIFDNVDQVAKDLSQNFINNQLLEPMSEYKNFKPEIMLSAFANTRNQYVNGDISEEEYKNTLENFQKISQENPAKGWLYSLGRKFGGFKTTAMLKRIAKFAESELKRVDEVTKYKEEIKSEVNEPEHKLVQEQVLVKEKSTKQKSLNQEISPKPPAETKPGSIPEEEIPPKNLEEARRSLKPVPNESDKKAPSSSYATDADGGSPKSVKDLVKHFDKLASQEQDDAKSNMQTRKSSERGGVKL